MVMHPQSIIIIALQLEIVKGLLETKYYYKLAINFFGIKCVDNKSSEFLLKL